MAVSVTTLESSRLRVSISPQGAELQSVFDKKKNLEYLWQADPAIWGKHSPVLFPIVGTLKENRYRYKDQWYSLNRHGFAREMEFQLEASTTESAVFLLTDSEQTRERYPFQFEFRIAYQLTNQGFSVSYRVNNTDSAPLYFSVGGHPAFRVPLQAHESYEDYQLKFDQLETAGRWPISKDGLIETFTEPLLNNSDQLLLNKPLFSRDALVFRQLRSESVSLQHQSGELAWTLKFEGFPFLGLWAAKGGDFLCVEPWCGIADSVNASQDLTEKDGINVLEPHEKWERNWSFSPSNF